MLYRTIGKTGLKISAVGIETHQWSGMGGRFFTTGEIKAIFKRAIKLGINFVDTGECYFFHSSERLIGEALGRNRKKFVIATKFGHKSEPGNIRASWTVAEVEKQLADSLSALKTSYIDVYQAHINSLQDKRFFLKNLEDIAIFIKKKKAEGKIKCFGICLGDDCVFDSGGKLILEAARKIKVDTVQVLYNRLDRTAEKGIFPAAKKVNAGIITRVPLAKGYLSSRFKPTNKNYDAFKVKEVDKIKKRELPKDADLAEWAIGWCLKDKIVSSVVPGCSSPEQLDSTVRALSFL
ncbi:MAG: aldo/keto reductase [bacterium]|nr:aldo/keto reductase [bacterium]